MTEPTSGHFKDKCHHISYRVYYEDTDAAGVVYYANYLKYAERARTESLRLLGVNQQELMSSQGIGFVVRHTEVDFLRPLMLDDVFVIETSLQEVRKVRMTMRQRIMRAGVECSSLMVTIACTDRQFRPAKIPEKLAAALADSFGVERA